MDSGENLLVPRPPSPSERRADIERLEAQLAEWTAIIAQYRARAKRAEGETKARWDGIADALQRRRNQACEQVMLLKHSGDGPWAALRSDLDRSWRDIRAAFREAAGGFQGRPEVAPPGQPGAPGGNPARRSSQARR